ncbi:MAG: alpha/beta fold hydrolase [Acidimicrobiales bacterium]
MHYRLPGVPGDSTSSVLLVHGAWHGAWCWDRVADSLMARGVPTVVVDLPGHGEDPGPFGDLHSDAERVRQVLGTLGHPVVLVGHSYGGAVITEAGLHPSVGHLVYLCALALDGGETCMSATVGLPGATAISYAGRPDLGAGMAVSDDGIVTLEPSTAAALLYNHCDPDTTAWAVSRLGPQPLITLQQVPDAVAWQARPSTYVVCSDDQIVHPELQRLMAERCAGTTVEWESDHSPFLSHPGRVVDLLAELAG